MLFKKTIDYYLKNENEEDEETQNKFTMFNVWCKKEGVIMPKLLYPAYFENGLLGVKCKQDI